MRKRLTLIGAGIIAILVASYLVLWLTAPRHRINVQGYEMIENGMTRAEVEAILGAPPGNYARTEAHEHQYLIAIPWLEWELFGRAGMTREGWTSDECHIAVIFDENGLVEEKRHFARSSASFFDRLRGWLGGR